MPQMQNSVPRRRGFGRPKPARILNLSALRPLGSRVVAGLLFAAAVTPAPAATNTVLNANGTGTGSLRQAIASAAAGNTIVFHPALSGQTIVLTNGELLLTRH